MFNDNLWHKLTSDDGQLPHAMLFAGPAGIGKRLLADALAVRLLCESPRRQGQPSCGQCASCLMMANGQHPDFRLLQSDAVAEDDESAAIDGEKKKASKQIRIQQVRELEEFFHLGGHRGGARVCLIDPAEAMNTITANALLKILEEPSPSFYFIMISHSWRRLLPTLLSRTRRIMMNYPDRASASSWLAQEGHGSHQKWLPFFRNAPMNLADAANSGRLKALEVMVADLLKPADALSTAGRWEPLVKSDNGISMEELVVTVQKWLFDLTRCASGVAPLYFVEQAHALDGLAKRTSLPAVLEAHKQVTQMRGLANHPLNPRLFIEDLCVRAFRPVLP